MYIFWLLNFSSIVIFSAINVKWAITKIEKREILFLMILEYENTIALELHTHEMKIIKAFIGNFNKTVKNRSKKLKKHKDINNNNRIYNFFIILTWLKTFLKLKLLRYLYNWKLFSKFSLPHINKKSFGIKN